MASTSYEIQLSESNPFQGAGPDSVRGYTAGTVGLIWQDQDGAWWTCLRGISNDGNAFESEDIGPCASADEAETEARDAYAIDQEPVEPVEDTETW